MTSADHLKDTGSNFQLGVISGKIDLVLVQMASQQASNEARFNKHDERFDAVEDDIAGLKRDRAWVVGAAAAVSALGATVAGFLGFAK